VTFYGFCIGVPDVSFLLGYDTPSLGNEFMMFRCLEMLETDYPVMQRHIPGEWKPYVT